MSDEFFDLSQVKFTNDSDVINPGETIFNPKPSDVKTLEGGDRIIGNNYINSDFGLGVFVEIPAQNSNPSASVDLSSQATLHVDGIRNQGSILTNGESDVLAGSATAKIAAIAETVTAAIAYADTLDTSAIADIFTYVDIKAIANGINNSGEIHTGKGSDTIDGEIEASVKAVATAAADVTAIVEEIAQAPMSESLTAFAEAIATSLAKAEIIARGINNKEGTITTGDGADTISATATSRAHTFADTDASAAFSSAPPENQALAEAVVDAFAEASDEAIAIDNTGGQIFMGRGDEDDIDIIEATAEASNKAIAINNIGGEIRTGGGKDTLTGYATGRESYGIYGGDILTGAGADRVEASSFGGGVTIKMGNGADFVKGFGDSTVYGGGGYDTFSLGSYNKSDFNIYTDNSFTVFELGDTTMQTRGFENYIFADGSYSDDLLMG